MKVIVGRGSAVVIITVIGIIVNIIKTAAELSVFNFSQSHNTNSREFMSNTFLV